MGGALGVIVIVVVFVVVLPNIADYRDVWGAVRDLSWPWILAIAIAAALNIVTFAPPYMAALPGLGLRPALAVTLASDASAYVAPGGQAVAIASTFAMLRGWGFGGRTATVAIMLVTISNQLVKAGTPIVALGMLSASGGRDPLLQTASLIGLVICGIFVLGMLLALASERQARRIGDLLSALVSRLLSVIKRGPVRWSGESFVSFRRDTIDILRRRGLVLMIATLAGHLTLYLLLIVCLRALGVTSNEVTIVESFAAWSLVRLLGSIPITPGGLGLVELALTGALVAFGGSEAEVVAAVLVYRFVAIAPTLVLGAVAAATWRRHNPGWQNDRPDLEAGRTSP